MTQCIPRFLSRGTLLLPAVLGLLAGPAFSDGANALAQRPSSLPVVRLEAGLVITRSVRILPATYRIAAPASADSAVVTVRGDGLTVDFSGVRLEGIDPTSDPDLARGVALRIEGGSNVRILNARIRGYHVGILARGTIGLDIVNSDLSHNWKPRLFSVIEHESLADWLSFHNNEGGEWLRFGAAIYLDNVHGGTIRGNTVTQGMNALLMNRVDHVTVRDNDFSFNSGLGIGLYRSSDNVIVRNRADFNVRGYSDGFYRRGQDSSGLLFYEQSSNNIVAFNSATHGGDGMFLWAGNYTMNTGQGGANDNVFYANDFSYAPANGLEATFSRNVFVANILEGNEYGLWGGYSFESPVIANCFAGNRWGIAIEHGQGNTIVGNRFAGDSTAIRLWGDSIQPSDWGYPKNRDTRSRDYHIARNAFEGNRSVLQVTGTTGLTASGNDTLPVSGGACSGIPTVPPEYGYLVPDLPGVPQEIPRRANQLRHRSAIIVDEWGPYDYRYPLLWPAGDSTRATPLRLGVHGPPGTWRIVGRRGVVTLSATSGRMGDTILVTPRADSTNDWSVTMEYRGGATVSPRGRRTAAGQPVRFTYERWEPAASWDFTTWAWSDSTDPRQGDSAWNRMRAQPPLLRREIRRLDFMWYRPTILELPQARFALEAEGRVSLPPGEYTLRSLSDDGIRIWVDGQLVIDNWTLHGTEVNHAALTGGTHEIRVRYFQIEGWAELRLDIVKGRQRSPGSPGPH
ncbi:MAG TPA: NosD domain-containing protein [Gemmatimonadaceae bacterium]